jgi:regulator of cell morphogenesis and NO signaling
MKITDPVKSFVENNSGCAVVFQELDIDFCCGGDVSLENACDEKGLQTDAVYQRLMELKSSPSDEKDISGLTPAELTVHIESTHHVYLKEALPRLTTLMEKVCQAHSTRHPELKPLQTVFESIRADLEPHLLKEERVLFPLIVKLERDGLGLQMQAAAGPIRVMRHEHDEVGSLLKQMRTLANGYVAPEDGCQSYELLYEELRKLEEDTHLHIHKENNILFPAIDLKEEVLTSS